MIRALRALTLAASLGVTVVACGGGSSSANQPSLDQLPTIKFVGNDTCPTSGAMNYFTGSNNAVKPAPVNSLPAVGQAIDEMPHAHINPPAKVTYNHNPPTSGCHYNLGYGNAPIQAGAYNQPVDSEYWVHNLEHGYVAILYNCPSGCDTQFQQLRTWYKGLPPESGVPYPRVVILPYANMNVPFAAVSWDWYDPIPVFSIDEVQKFYDNHKGNAAEKGGQ
ncbi:MAG: DUF3105 domain-containing protein [Candidatus Dormibacteria bacterium]